MEEELSQIKKNDTWELVPRTKDKNVIGTKWVFRNKLDENGQVTRNKERLVCKGYAHIEGVDFEETFALFPGWKQPKQSWTMNAPNRSKYIRWM